MAPPTHTPFTPEIRMRNLGHVIGRWNEAQARLQGIRDEVSKTSDTLPARALFFIETLRVRGMTADELTRFAGITKRETSALLEGRHVPIRIPLAASLVLDVPLNFAMMMTRSGPFPPALKHVESTWRTRAAGCAFLGQCLAAGKWIKYGHQPSEPAGVALLGHRMIAAGTTARRLSQVTGVSCGALADALARRAPLSMSDLLYAGLGLPDRLEELLFLGGMPAQDLRGHAPLRAVLEKADRPFDADRLVEGE